MTTDICLFFSSKLVDDQRHISLSLYNLWMKKVMHLTAGQQVDFYVVNNKAAQQHELRAVTSYIICAALRDSQPLLDGGQGKNRISGQTCRRTRRERREGSESRIFV